MLFYAEELMKSEERIKNIAQMTVEEKIADSLLLIYNSYGLHEKDDLKKYDILLSRQEIAELAGTTYEQVIRTLTEFKRNKLIETSGKKITIRNYNRLNSLVSNYSLS